MPTHARKPVRSTLSFSNLCTGAVWNTPNSLLTTQTNPTQTQTVRNKRTFWQELGAGEGIGFEKKGEAQGCDLLSGTVTHKTPQQE